MRRPIGQGTPGQNPMRHQNRFLASRWPAPTASGCGLPLGSGSAATPPGNWSGRVDPGSEWEARRGGTKPPFHQSMLQHGVGLASRYRLDVVCIHQHLLQVAFQHCPDWSPVNSRSFHGQMSHPVFLEPVCRASKSWVKVPNARICWCFTPLASHTLMQALTVFLCTSSPAQRA